MTGRVITPNEKSWRPGGDSNPRSDRSRSLAVASNSSLKGEQGMRTIVRCQDVSVPEPELPAVLYLVPSPCSRTRYLTREADGRFLLHESGRDGFGSYERELTRDEAIALAAQAGV